MALAEVLAGAQLIKTLATTLRDKNLIKPGIGGSLPDLADVATGIGQMVEDGFFSLGGVNKDDPSAVTDALVSKFTTAVETYQKLFPTQLQPTGQLGQDMLNILKRPTCHGERTDRQPPAIGPAATAISPSPLATSRPKLRYLVQTLPSVSRATDIVAKAWEIWTKQIYLDIQETSDESEANVVIHIFDLDGPGRNLADADSGPPRGSRMEVRMDSAEDWSPDKLLYASIHEFGHILGLHHSITPYDIMFKSYQPDYFHVHKDNKDVISENDKSRIQEIWSPRKR